MVLPPCRNAEGVGRGIVGKIGVSDDLPRIVNGVCLAVSSRRAFPGPSRSISVPGMINMRTQIKWCARPTNRPPPPN